MLEMIKEYMQNGYRIETMDIDAEEEETVNIEITLIKEYIKLK